MEDVQQREVRWLAAGMAEREMEQVHGFLSFLLLSANNARARNQMETRQASGHLRGLRPGELPNVIALVLFWTGLPIARPTASTAGVGRIRAAIRWERVLAAAAPVRPGGG